MKNFTYLIRALFFCAISSAYVSPVFSQLVEKHVTLRGTGEHVGFLEYTPANYTNEGDVKHPVIIFLHGIGERGNGTSDLKNVARIGLPRMIRLGHNMTFTWNGKTETFLVVAPQCPKNYGMWPDLIVKEMIRYVKENLRVDEDRIYLTGLSMGGGGTYKFISKQQDQAEIVAAAATVCAPCTFTDGSNVAKAKLPVWSFHAANDSIALAKCTESAIKKINAANPVVKPLKTIWPDGGHPVWDRVYTDTNYRYNGVVNIYEWFLGQNKTFKPNALPVANAGSDFRVSPLQETVVLNASASTDADGRLVRYVWKKISGPKVGNINNAMSADPSTTVTGLTQTGTYQYELAVVDNRASYTKDTVTITVAADASLPVPNKLPVAKAGNDIKIMLPTTATLTGSGTDSDGKIVAYKWIKTSGGDVKIAHADSAITKLDSLKVGVYSFKLTVTDNSKAVAADEVMVTVLADTTKKPEAQKPDTVKPAGPLPVDTATKNPTTSPAPKANKPPVARVTPDQSIPVEWNYFPSVSGYPSTDEDGWIAKFSWKKISGPDSFNIVSPSSCRTRINQLVAGVYVFRATVYDNKGASSYADVKITMTTREQRKNATSSNSAAVDTVAATAPIPVTEVKMPAEVTLSPNPARGMVNLVYDADITGKSVINIFDVTGKMIKSIPFYKQEGTYRHNLEISALKPGIYYVDVRTATKTGMQIKLIKQ